jgi:hypothetical protein
MNQQGVRLCEDGGVSVGVSLAIYEMVKARNNPGLVVS